MEVISVTLVLAAFVAGVYLFYRVLAAVVGLAVRKVPHVAGRCRESLPRGVENSVRKKRAAGSA